MPGGDRTGPLGMGGMTGRAAGYCARFGKPGHANPAFGRGFGMGGSRGRSFQGRGSGGGGRGWRNMFFATGLPHWARFGGGVSQFLCQMPYQNPDPEMEKQALKNQAQILKQALDFVEKRLSEIKGNSAED